MIEDAMLLKRPDFLSFIKFAGFSTFSGLVTHYLMNPREKLIVNENNVVVATGCDSGLGYSMALHCHEKLRMSVVACVHQLNSTGAIKLKTMFENSNRFHLVELEITEDESINEVRKFVNGLLEGNKDFELTALVNNCGVMVFGESEWQTNRIIDQQINVNLIGTIKMTTAMLPLIRKHKSRIINVSSHCGFRNLPTLTVYGATKAGIMSYTEGLRLEMQQYGVDVVDFIPGSFITSSNITANQLVYAAEMRESFDEEQVKFYGEYFDRLNLYLSAISGEKNPQVLANPLIISTFEEALLDTPPKRRYICEPWRYKWYHLLFKISPASISDWLIHKFLSLPRFNPKAIQNSS